MFFLRLSYDIILSLEIRESTPSNSLSSLVFLAASTDRYALSFLFISLVQIFLIGFTL